MRWDVVSIFPDYLAPARLSLVGKAIESGLVDLAVHDLRDWTHDRHRTVDDTPYGGGAGMVMRPDPWGEALDDVLGVSTSLDERTGESVDESEGVAPLAELGGRSYRGSEGVAPLADPVLLIPTPSGEVLTQTMAAELATESHVVVACGRYEGIDARVAEHYRTRCRVREFSIGDYVLNGGEVAALVVIEAVVRLLPGVVGNPQSLVEESHSDEGLLEYPVYTKPPTWRGLEVPPVLLSGHHGEIARWRREQSLARTAERRPDLLPPRD